MVWVLRICLGAIVLGYAAWLGLPLAQTLSSGSTVAQAWAGLASAASPQALALASALLATIVLYGLGGLATAVGFSWAPGFFFLGVLGEIGLRLAVASGATSPVPAAMDIAARMDAALRPFGILLETTPLALAALLAVGLCIVATGVWRGQKGAALTRVWTQPPVWA